MVVGGGGIAGAPPRRQEDEQKERAGHARLDGFLHPALSSSTVPLLIPSCPSYERRYRPPPLCTRRPRTRCARVARNADLYVLRRLPHERPIVHATCQLQRRGIARGPVAHQWGRFPPRRQVQKKTLAAVGP